MEVFFILLLRFQSKKKLDRVSGCWTQAWNEWVCRLCGEAACIEWTCPRLSSTSFTQGSCDRNGRVLLPPFLATTSSFMHECRYMNNTLQQFMHLVLRIRRTAYESAAAPTSHSATHPAEFNAVCRSKPNLPNQTDSHAALLPYLTHRLDVVHEWSGVWNGPHVRHKSCLL